MKIVPGPRLASANDGRANFVYEYEVHMQTVR